MVSCKAIALFFVAILINNAFLMGLFMLFIISQDEEKEERQHKYDYDPEWKSVKSKLAKFGRSSILRRILEYIPGFELVAKKLDELSTVVHVALDAVLLPFEAIESIHRWFNGQISGRRCAKTIVDASAAVAGGIGGAAVGASVGAAGGPFGSIIGGIIGGIFGSSIASAIMSHLTERIFDLPKTVAVERAYDFLGVKQSSTNYDINQAFRKRAQSYHPDSRYGNEKLFMELQANMQLIHEDCRRTFRT